MGATVTKKDELLKKVRYAEEHPNAEMAVEGVWKNYLMDLDFCVLHYMITFLDQMIFMFHHHKSDVLVCVPEIQLKVKLENQKKVKNILRS